MNENIARLVREGRVYYGSVQRGYFVSKPFDEIAKQLIVNAKEVSDLPIMTEIGAFSHDANDKLYASVTVVPFSGFGGCRRLETFDVGGKKSVDFCAFADPLFRDGGPVATMDEYGWILSVLPGFISESIRAACGDVHEAFGRFHPLRFIGAELLKLEVSRCREDVRKYVLQPVRLKVVEARIGQVKDPMQRDGLYGPSEAEMAVTYVCQTETGAHEGFSPMDGEVVSRCFCWGNRNTRAVFTMDSLRAEAELVADYMRTAFTDIVDDVIIGF